MLLLGLFMIIAECAAVSTALAAHLTKPSSASVVFALLPHLTVCFLRSPPVRTAPLSLHVSLPVTFRTIWLILVRCTSGSLIRCASGSCVSNPSECPYVWQCPVGQVQCFDGSCAASAADCGVANERCPSGAPFLYVERGKKTFFTSFVRD